MPEKRDVTARGLSKPRASLGKANGIIEYVGGPHPYYWIGTTTGDYFGSIDASALRKFVNASLEFEEADDD